MRVLLRQRMAWAVMVLLAINASNASAHFVWIQTEGGEGQLVVRSGFGEPEGWDPELADRMKSAKFWTRFAGGLQPLVVPYDAKQEEYRTSVAGSAPSAVIGSCDFGVVQLGSRPASWLRYTAKSLVGEPSTWAEDKPTNDLRIELLAKLDGNRVQLKALHLGQPLADLTIKAQTPKGDNVELKTDTQGVAYWPLAEAGVYGCYVGKTTKEPGESGGKKYEALMDYTTLTFAIAKSP